MFKLCPPSLVKKLLHRFLAALLPLSILVCSTAFAQVAPTASDAVPATPSTGDLADADASQLPDGFLTAIQIKELVTGKQVTGLAQYLGNTNNDTYRFYADGTAFFTTKGGFGSYRYKGNGKWVARKSGESELICWDIKGTWENRSCAPVSVASGQIRFGNFFVQEKKK